MKRPWLLALIGANLLALIALVFIYPHLMISPGPLIEPHAQKIGTDCFACHTPWRGVSDAGCIDCHAVADIGLRTTTGAPLPRKTVKTSFHQQLQTETCLACHADHLGSKRSLASRKRFSHDLLKPATRQACDSCHRAPSDTLHKKVAGNCAACHQSQAWKPASFEHDSYFLLDRDHDVACATCHTGRDFRSYTCYGCHEHTPARIRAEHEEEGIRDFEQCVECHRSPDEHSARRGGGPGRRGGDDD